MSLWSAALLRGLPWLTQLRVRVHAARFKTARLALSWPQAVGARWLPCSHCSRSDVSASRWKETFGSVTKCRGTGLGGPCWLPAYRPQVRLCQSLIRSFSHGQEESLSLCGTVIGVWSRGSPGNPQSIQNSACGLEGGTRLGAAEGSESVLVSFAPRHWVPPGLKIPVKSVLQYHWFALEPQTGQGGVRNARLSHLPSSILNWDRLGGAGWERTSNDSIGSSCRRVPSSALPSRLSVVGRTASGGAHGAAGRDRGGQAGLAGGAARGPHLRGGGGCSPRDLDVLKAPHFQELHLEVLLAERRVVEGLAVLRVPPEQVGVKGQSLASPSTCKSKARWSDLLPPPRHPSQGTIPADGVSQDCTHLSAFCPLATVQSWAGDALGCLLC